MPDPRRTYQPLTDEQLDELAEITPRDIEDAKRTWREQASPAFRDLLDASPIDGESAPPA